MLPPPDHPRIPIRHHPILIVFHLSKTLTSPESFLRVDPKGVILSLQVLIILQLPDGVIVLALHISKSLMDGKVPVRVLRDAVGDTGRRLLLLLLVGGLQEGDLQLGGEGDAWYGRGF
jgi:hypothetical protein